MCWWGRPGTRDSVANPCIGIGILHRATDARVLRRRARGRGERGRSVRGSKAARRGIRERAVRVEALSRKLRRGRIRLGRTDGGDAGVTAVVGERGLARVRLFVRGLATGLLVHRDGLLFVEAIVCRRDKGRVTRASGLAVAPIENGQNEGANPEYCRHISDRNISQRSILLTKREPEEDRSSLLSSTPSGQTVHEIITSSLGIGVLGGVLAPDLRPGRYGGNEAEMDH